MVISVDCNSAAVPSWQLLCNKYITTNLSYFSPFFLAPLFLSILFSLSSPLEESKVDDIQRLANINILQQRHQSNQSDTLNQVRSLTRPSLPVSTTMKKKSSCNSKVHWLRASSANFTSGCRSKFEILRDGHAILQDSELFKWLDWRREYIELLSSCLLGTFFQHLNKDAFTFLFCFFTSGFVTCFKAPPFCSTLARRSQTTESESGKYAQRKDEEWEGKKAGHKHTHTFTRAHTPAVLLKRTMADRDGCSGFSLLADYVNGSQQHDKPIRPFLGRHVLGASRMRLSGILFRRASVHTSKMTLAQICCAVGEWHRSCEMVGYIVEGVGSWRRVSNVIYSRAVACVRRLRLGSSGGGCSSDSFYLFICLRTRHKRSPGFFFSIPLLCFFFLLL